MDTKSQECPEKSRKIRYRETYDNGGWWWLMWFGFFLAWRSCAGILLSLFFANGDVYSPGYSIGALISFGIFLTIAIYGSKNSPEGVSTFFIVLYVLGILANLSINPFILVFYFLFLIPMYKVSQGRLYGEYLVKNDDEHGLRYKGYRCDPEAEETDRCLIYNNRHIDKDKLLQGEIEYLLKLPKERLKIGYECIRKNRKLKKHAPVFRGILLEAYNSVLFPEEQEDMDFLQALDETSLKPEADTNRKIKRTVENQCEQEENFSWLRAVETAEEDWQDLSDAAQMEDAGDDSWATLIDQAEGYQRNTVAQKTRGTSEKRVGAVIGGVAAVVCVAAIGIVGAVALNHAVGEDSAVSSVVTGSDKESTVNTMEEAETATSAKSNKLTVEDQDEIAAGVAARKAEKERKKAAGSSSDYQKTATASSDNFVQDKMYNTVAVTETSGQATDDVPEETSVTAEKLMTEEQSATEEQTMPVEQEAAPSENEQAPAAVSDIYLEDTYNSYAAQIQSESVSLVSQLQAGTIDYMTASQQLRNLYSTGNQAMTNYWMNGNCSYADMTTWSNKLWNVYTAESPKLVGAGQ